MMRSPLPDPENLPSPRAESWKYTNLPRAVPPNLAREAAPQTASVHVAKNKEHREEIAFSARDNTRHAPRLKITLEEGAQATVIERLEGEGAYWRNMGAEIVLGPNAHLRHYRIWADSESGVSTVGTSVTQARDSSYAAFYLFQSGKLARNEIHVTLEGSGAQCDLNGVSLLRGKQHGDTTILIEHKAPDCRSSQFFRAVLSDESRGVFQGKIHVHRIAQRTDGYQLSNALLLSEKAEMDTKPELEIYADDVKCSHGATTGRLNDESLFYLRARGLSEAQARALLIQAFADEVADKISDEPVRMAVKDDVQLWLRDTG
ncbi:MAG: Fe-S cluster assembly protein SufD [Alphaproteobacteria bacterium]|nr:Fe-S cluster assembly protein SufD [Alphaproteobacteria bacterium]